jgi:hypothetical protein
MYALLHMFHAVIATSLLIASSSSLFDQQIVKGSWTAVSALKPATKTQILPINGKRLEGEFVSATADAITLRTAGAERTISRSEVREVKVRTAGGRLKSGGIGAAIGGGIMLGAAGILLAGTGGSDLTGVILIGSTFYGGLAGFGIGALAGGRTTI